MDIKDSDTVEYDFLISLDQDYRNNNNRKNKKINKKRNGINSRETKFLYKTDWSRKEHSISR